MALSEAVGLAVAGIKAQMISRYLGDLEAERDGDAARFSRMVGRGGEPLGSREKWIEHVVSGLNHPALCEHTPAVREALCKRASSLGIVFEGSYKESESE